MKTLLIPIFAIGLLLGQSSMLSSDELDKKLHEECLYPTVMIAIGNDGTGSGVIVRSDKVGDVYRNVVMTCGHLFHVKEAKALEGEEVPIVVRLGKYEKWSTFVGYEEYSAKVHCWERKRDVGCVVFSSKKPMPVAKLNFNPTLYIGNEVLRIGCGGGNPMRIDFGKITGINSRIPGLTEGTIRTSAYTIPGDSGGPLYRKYEVIGIAQAIQGVRMGWAGQPTFKLSHFIPVSRYKDWDKDIDNEVEFMWDKTKQLPVIPFKMMELDKLKPVEEFVPKSYWDKNPPKPKFPPLFIEMH